MSQRYWLTSYGGWVDTSVITSANALYDQLCRLFAWSDTVDMAYAWANSAEEQARHWRTMPLEKIRHAVIGTAFAQTEPRALEILDEKEDRLRLIITSRGTFHPKVVLGKRGSEAWAIVGSANFTKAAYSTNTEVSVVLRGSTNSGDIRKIQDFIDEQWDRGVTLDADWLVKYTAAWKKARTNKVIVPGAPLEPDDLDSFEMSWEQYVEMIKRQHDRPLADGNRIRVSDEGSYLEEMAMSRRMFRKNPAFKDIEVANRKFMLGMPPSTGALGRMQQAGYGKNLVISHPERIGAALDRLPLSGPITRQAAVDVITRLTELRGVNVGVASRLLAAKRPDYFVSVNGGSKHRLRELMDGQTVSSEVGYLRLLDRVWATQWHQAKRPPGGRAREIWEGRAALLDAAVYEQV